MAAGAAEVGGSVGVEAYMYAWGRIWELMGAADQPPWCTSDEQLDPRLKELKDLVRWFDMWREYNMKSKATKHLKKVGHMHEQASHTRAGPHACAYACTLRMRICIRMCMHMCMRAYAYTHTRIYACPSALTSPSAEPGA